MRGNIFNVVAVDDGYGDIKVDNGGTSITPSFVTPFIPNPENEFSGEEENLSQYIASEVNGGKFIVGDYAVKLDPSIHWSARENKHTDYTFPVLFKTVLGLASKEYEEVDLLMMNLPIKYDTPGRRQILKDIVLGTHRVKVSMDGDNFQNRTIDVNDLMIKKQPFGSLCDLMLDNEGEVANLDVAKSFNVLVDIGSRTVNILTVDALEEQPHLTTQTNDGMYSAYYQIGKYLESELGIRIPDGKLSRLVKTKEIQGRDISSVIEKAYENHAVKIINLLETLLLDSWGFVENLVFTGGGAEALKPYLQGSIQGANTIFLDKYSNVKGLRKYGLRKTGGGR